MTWGLGRRWLRPMRIIAGEYRSRTILAPDGLTTRPIPDRVKESFFGMLGSRIEGAKVVDLFAGSGAIGLEALSRGAASCLFVDQDKGAIAMLRRNVETLGCAARAQIVHGDALGLSVSARCPRPVDLLFFDPPYPLVEDPTGWARVKAQASRLAALLSDDGFLIIRTPNPFQLTVGPVAEMADEEAKRPRGKPAKARRPDRPRRGKIDELDELASMMESGEAVEMGAEAETPRKEAEVQGVRVFGEAALTVVLEPADVNLDATRGPESHVYGKTAVHWYMRDPALPR